ncbi:hypothetical protein PGT21_018924 [Puccinia graminis f. sp. tritici]|uniref:Uncharacterized protein n=1 Tax=Puccinia graminis f. sp. tritici TaxID=56615 RepID=A0A5B0NCG4_PUCGR|nr:hypothetical protein PGT21_018924 [Puccinia graminis f. sp. tritici]
MRAWKSAKPAWSILCPTWACAQTHLQHHITIQLEHKPNAIIKPEICDLIRENVNGKGMKISNAMKTFNVSWCQIQRIKGEDPNLIRTHKKWPGKFTDNMKIEAAHATQPEINNNPCGGSRLHQGLIRCEAWNRTDLIEQRANFVNLVWTLVDQWSLLMRLVLTYIPVKHLDTLPPPGNKAKQITLIGALSVEGFDYYALLNTNNTKAKG